MEKLTLNREDEECCTYIYRYDIERKRVAIKIYI